MSRNDLLLRLAAATVGIIALAIAAATVRSPVESGSPGADGPGEGPNGGQASPTEPPTTTDFPDVFELLVFAFLILVALSIAWFLIAHRRELLKTIGTGLVILLFAGTLAFVMYEHAATIAELLGGQEPQPEMDDGGGEPGGEGDDGQTDDETISLPMGPILALLTVVTAIFVGAFVLSSHRSEDGVEDRGELIDQDPESIEDRTDALGAAAGRAAERIEAADDVDNEVYRAWVTMTSLLDVPRPESSTPGEFADAAVDAGMHPEHVSELTRLFEDVRYGYAEPDDAVENRSISVLRRIEETYAPEEPSPSERTSPSEGSSTSDDGADSSRRSFWPWRKER